MPPVVLLKTPVDAEMLDPTQEGVSNLCPFEPHEGWRAFQLLAAQSLPAMASQAAFDIQRLTETALTIKEPYEPIQPHGLEVWRVEERIAHEAPATSLFLAREARATADIQRLRDATGSLIDQTTAAQVQAAVLIENARFQYERLQTLIDPPKLAAMQALYERSLIEQTRYRLSPEDYEAAQEQARLYDDIFTVVYAYCPLYHESHKERQQDAELVAVLTRLAMRLRPGLRNPYAAGELRRQAAQAGLSRRVYLRTTIFPAAIIRVASEVATPSACGWGGSGW